MTLPPRIILLDSNAYFRLALTIHPLLAPEFGDPPPYKLLVLKELDEEYSRSARLKNKFEWVRRPEFRRDREARRYEPRGKIVQQAETAFSFVAHHAHTHGISVSRIDLKALAHGIARSYPVVSDDAGMQQIADALGIERWPVLKLLKLMVTERRIGLEVVHQIVQYLAHENDLPTSNLDRLRKEYRTYFNADPPL